MSFTVRLRKVAGKFFVWIFLCYWVGLLNERDAMLGWEKVFFLLFFVCLYWFVLYFA